MSQLDAHAKKLDGGQSLTEEEASEAAEALIREDIADDSKARFLLSLHEKGETVEEVTAFARTFRRYASDPGLGDWADRGIDIVGTGGSGFGGYNISTVTSFVVAASGVPVLKHGNRAITSQSGAADFLGAMGVQTQADPAVLRQSLEEIGFCFFFAPAFHPAFKAIMPVRKQLAAEGKRTIFNILGPLINPAKPAHQLLGVYAQSWVKPLAQSLTALGLKRGLAVHCELKAGTVMDELSTAGINHVHGMGELSDLSERWEPEQQGFSRTPPATLEGGTAAENVVIFNALLSGDSTYKGLADTIVFNAGAALLCAGAVGTFQAGYETARETLLGGRLKSWVEQMQSFYRYRPESS